MSPVDPQRLRQLEAGTTPSTTLTEILAIDQRELLTAVLPHAPEALTIAVAEAQQLGVLARMRGVGEALRAHTDEATQARLAEHVSDTVRGWMCFALASAAGEAPVLLERMRPGADDAHFGVREWAWLAARPGLVAQLDGSIAALREWTAEPSERIRRFASEALRPRGVWSSHIAVLKQDPERALPLLEPLRADPSRYVQDSVANWINDASKTRPDWALALGERWLEESPTEATARIVRRGLRSIGHAAAAAPPSRA